MEACGASNVAQSFDVDSTSGTGRIRDTATGRCLTMKTCTLGAGIQKSVEVGLQACGEDECDGKSSQWIASAGTAAGSTIFKSVLKGTAGECYVLNVRNADTLPVVAYGDPSCDPNSKNNQWLDADGGTMHSSTGMGCEPNCCLTAEPCLPPSCVLPIGWAWPFVTIITLGAAVYVGGGVVYGHKTMGRPLGATAHPHHDQIVALGGLVIDGAVYSMTVTRERFVGVGPSTPNGLTQSLAAEQSAEQCGADAPTAAAPSSEAQADFSEDVIE